MKILALILCCAGLHANSQIKPDTAHNLNEITIRPYFSPQPLLRTTGAVAVIEPAQAALQPVKSFVPVMNTIAGVRMEERSPGSYRLSIRGSLLRSPFGIRNIKIYVEDFPLTDAGGNTYLNAMDIAAAGNITVLKGPQSGIYGANSGGVVLLNPSAILAQDSLQLSAALSGGSYGLFRESIAIGKTGKKYSFNLQHSYQRSDGYRDNSGMKRNYTQLFQRWNYSSKANLSALLFYSDLAYRTPGGLTEAQFADNPAASRPAAGKIPGASEQQAGIYSKTVFGGITNQWDISSKFRQVTSVFASYTDFKNPFITNYEQRYESTLGLRTYVEYVENSNNLNWKFDLGFEHSKTHSDVRNYDNNRGTRGSQQKQDELNAAGTFGFAHINVDIFKRVLVEFSASLNDYRYKYSSSFPKEIAQKKQVLDLQLMPRAAVSWLITPDIVWNASLSRGYSPPSLAEIRASDQVINTDLQPEKGWNIESGFKYLPAAGFFQLDLTAFSYKLSQAIVRRLNENDTEYFINAGGTRQNGIEASTSFFLLKDRKNSLLRKLTLRNAATFSHFRFAGYSNSNQDYSGKKLSGVPAFGLVSGLEGTLPGGFSTFIQHNYTSSIPLNDANTATAKAYHLLQMGINFRNTSIAGFPLEIFATADNLLNERYSLGNDLNAAAGRYYNAAPLRNFSAGVKVSL